MSDWVSTTEKRLTEYAKKEGLLGYDDSKKLDYRLIERAGGTETWTVSMYDTETETYGELYAICVKTKDQVFLSDTRVRLTQEKLEDVFQELKLGIPRGMTRTPSKRAPLGERYRSLRGVEYEVFVKDKRYSVHLTHLIEYRGLHCLLKFLNDKKLARMLPVERRYEYTGPRLLGFFQVQVIEKISGICGDFYYNSSLQDRINVLKQIAPVYKALWEVDLKHGKKIGSIDLSGDSTFGMPESISIRDVYRNRLFSGPFSSNSAYLKAWIRYCIQRMEGAAQNENRELTKYELAISKMVDSDFKISPEVEEVPVVLSHPSMAIFRMIFTSTKPHVLQDINLTLDKSLEASPFAESVLDIERHFWLDADGTQKIYCDSQKLHDAFWNEIPGWKKCLKSKATQTYLKWARIGYVIRDGPDHEDAFDFLRKHT